MILALAGQEEAALDRIEVVLEEPSVFSRAGVRREPAFQGAPGPSALRGLAGRG